MIDWLSSLQVRKPWLLIASALVITAISTFFALRLTLQTGFESLLPESKPSVQELKRVSALTNGVSTVFVVLEGDAQTKVTALRAAADALVPRLEKIGEPWVGHAETGVHDGIKFLSPRAGLFLSKEKLQSLKDDVDARYAKAVGAASGLFVDLEDESGTDGGTSADGGVVGPQTIDFTTLRESLRIEGADPDRYPDGYYQSQDGHSIVVLVRSKIASGDFDKGSEVLRRIRAAVDELNVKQFDPNITVGYAGDLETSVTEFEAINRDLTDVGILGALMIAGVVLLYYLRGRMVLLLLATIGIGLSWTFGMTQLTIGRLNIATGFLFTIIGGNGINFAIIYMARYLEARRTLDVPKSLNVALRETWVPTLTAGAAAGASYGSLGATDFRGFHDFGIIGGVGILLCWVATYWALPSMLAVTEKVWPLDKDVGGPLAKLRAKTGNGNFGAPFEYLVSHFPTAVAVIGLALAVAGAAAGVYWVKSDPIEYDLRNLRTDASSRANEMRLDALGNTVTGHVGADGMAILVDDPAQVPELKAALYARRDAAAEDLKPFNTLHALQDFVPEDQAEKIPMLMRLRQRLLRARAQGAVTDEDWAKIEPILPPENLQQFGMADLPEAVARAFTETDGRRGRIVYISPVSNFLVDNAKYLFRWADSYRSTTLSGGKTILGSGRAVIYADMWASVVEDVPKAVLLSFAATVLVVIVAFRTGRSTLAVLGALLVGVAWMLAAVVAFDVKLNFLNFVALPITFGIGVDYSVNVVQRYAQEGRGSALLAIRETGGAVILCSLTTTLGYLALVRSANFGVRSLGIAAFIGEVCCLLASVLVLPAVLLLIDRRSGVEAG
jgi:predicted RND superfamily exporter protein